MPFLGPLLGGIASGALGVIGQGSANAANAQQNELARKFSAKEAAKQRDWAKGMSNTAYRRAMFDMKKAGLNPMLAFSQGGASTPAGGQASAAQGIQQQNVMDQVASSANEVFKRSMEKKRLTQDLKNLKQQEKTLRATET
jgi:hypothetical protein